MNLTVPTPAVMAAHAQAVRTGLDPTLAVGVAMFGLDYPLFDGDPEWSGPRPTWSRTHYAIQLTEACRAPHPHPTESRRAA